MTSKKAASFIEALEHRAERLSTRLSAMWKHDPTVSVSFLADFEELLVQIEQGDIHAKFANAELTRIYQEHHPTLNDPPVQHRNISTAGARPVPGHGQFYELDLPGVYLAIDYADSPAYQNAKPDRRIWLTYTNSRARQLI